MKIAVKRKYRNLFQKLVNGDVHAVHSHQDDFEIIAKVAIRLKNQPPGKKLNPRDILLLQEIEFILPPFIQLIDKCLEKSAEYMYKDFIRKDMMCERKKALKGDKDVIKRYNNLVKDWGKYEPGKFQRIKP